MSSHESPTLISSYDHLIRALVEEITNTLPGDTIVLNVYILEPGDSSKLILDTLRKAAVRGVNTSISVDYTVASHLSRLWERTSTLLPEAVELGRAFPEQVRATRRKVPDHSKYAVVRRITQPSTAIFGGINLGDRFQAWRDFMVRLAGDHVSQLIRKLGVEGSENDVAPLTGIEDIRFVINNPPTSRFEIRSAYLELVHDPQWVHYVVAMAYLDRFGARILAQALARGASLDLVLPLRANVYHHANMKTLRHLLKKKNGQLRVFLCPAMLHAKVLQARDQHGKTLSFLGSANLKRNSFYRFGELNALISDQRFNDALAGDLAALMDTSQRVSHGSAVRYSRVFAFFEECLG